MNLIGSYNFLSESQFMFQESDCPHNNDPMNEHQRITETT